MKRYGLVVAIVALVLAVVMPPIERAAPVHRMVAIVDISQSMGVMDVTMDGLAGGGTTTDATPISRLTLAKLTIAQLLRSLECGSELGLGIFAGGRTTLLLRPVEVCEHYAGLLGSINNVDGRMRHENASRIGKALHQGLRVAHASGDESIMLLFTDGHEAPPLREGQVGLPRSENLGIHGYLIGVGGTLPVPIPKVDADGRDIGFWQAADVIQRPGRASGEERSRREDAHLELLANLSGLKYLPLDSTTAVVDQLVSAPTSHHRLAPRDYRWVAALVALLCLCLSLVWPVTARKPAT